MKKLKCLSMPRCLQTVRYTNFTMFESTKIMYVTVMYWYMRTLRSHQHHSSHFSGGNRWAKAAPVTYCTKPSGGSPARMLFTQTSGLFTHIWAITHLVH